VCPSDPETPAIASLEAGIPEVQVAPLAGPAQDRIFQLYFWYRLANGGLVSDFFGPMDWSFDPSAEGSAARGVIQVKTFTTGSPATLTAAKKDDPGKTAKVTLTRWASPVDATASKGGSDVVTAPHQSGSIPTVAVVEGEGSAGCADTPNNLWERYAFVGAAAVGEHNPPCSIAILSGTNRLLFQSPPTAAAWATSGATIDVAPDMKEPLQLDVTVFIAVTARTASILSGMALTDTDQLVDDVGASAEAIAKMDVDLANLTYEANRVGVRVVVSKYEHLPVTDDLPAKVGADPQDCSIARNLTSLTGLSTTWIAPTMISVYYVDRIFVEDEGDAGVRGLYCPPSGTTGPLLFISFTRHTTTALAHEIGHALSLDHPEKLKLDPVKMLGSTNLMTIAAMDGPLAADVRSQLTLGQVFRMNVSNNSWLNRTGGPRGGASVRNCGIGECPPQEFSVR
jgi:hypothetical protein